MPPGNTPINVPFYLINVTFYGQLLIYTTFPDNQHASIMMWDIKQFLAKPLASMSTT